MKLKKVAEGMTLHWPDDSPMRGRMRGRAGTVVDLDAPEEEFFLAGQHYKLGDAPDATEPTPITDSDALAYLIQKTGRAPETPPAVEKVAQEARKEAPAALDGIPEPETPKAQEASDEKAPRGRAGRKRTSARSS